MVNFSLNPGSLMGIILAFAGVGLYLLRSFRPNLARDYDVFFAAVALLCGGIFFFQSWRLDPLLQFGVFLLTGSSLFFAYDSIRLRGIATEQAKRSTPLVDDDRPVSRVYRYEAPPTQEPAYAYDSFQQERQPPARRIRGSEDSISPEYRNSGYSEGGGYEGEGSRPSRRRPSGNRRPSSPPEAYGSPDDNYPPEGRPSRRRPRPSADGGYRETPDRPEYGGNDYDSSSYGTPRYGSAEYSGPTPNAGGYGSSPYGSSYESGNYGASGYENPGSSDYGSNAADSGYRDYRGPNEGYGGPPESDRPSPRRPRRRPAAPPQNEPGSPYVDYRPLSNQPDMEVDNSAHFDD